MKKLRQCHVPMYK